MKKGKIKVFEGFAGYGGASFGLKRSGLPYEVVGYSGIDPNAVEFPVEDFFKRQRKNKSFEIIVPLWQRT